MSFALDLFLSNRGSDNAFRRRVIYFYWGWWLRKTEFVKCDAEGYSYFPIVKQSPDFLFGHGCHHVF